MALRKRKSKKVKKSKKSNAYKWVLLTPVLWAAIYVLTLCVINQMHSHSYRMVERLHDLGYKSVLIQSYVLKQCKKMSQGGKDGQGY